LPKIQIKNAAVVFPTGCAYYKVLPDFYPVVSEVESKQITACLPELSSQATNPTYFCG
jgi:hypothetical protein